MRQVDLHIQAGLLLVALCACGQGTFTFDQQSSTDDSPLAYGSGPTVQSQLPSAGQSFSPSLAGVDFIRLKFNDGDLTDGLGANIYLNLRTDSITGPILGTTAAVTMADGFRGVRDFFLPATVSLTSGATYYFELTLQSGGPWRTSIASYNYTGGEAFRQGLPYPGGDYWFREGLYVIPEPSSAVLSLVVGGTLVLLRRTKRV